MARINPAIAANAQRSVLNVGGGSRRIAIPPQYIGWRHCILDIDPGVEPDILADARDLATTEAGCFDAVYCSHNLEHYPHHDVPKVLRGFAHVLKADGFVHIRVPDVGGVMRHATRNNLDMDAVLYQSPAGPITVQDLIYGYSEQIKNSGNDFYMHKTGFSAKILEKFLVENGFPFAFVTVDSFEICGIAFKQEPTQQHRTLLNLPAAGGQS